MSVDDVVDRDYDVTIFISKYLYLADTIKIAIIFIEKTFGISNKVKSVLFICTF